MADEVLTEEQLAALPLEEIRRRALAEESQPRDEQGRFVAAKEEPKAEPEPTPEPEPEATVYRRTIDLGDGSGVQVFEAPSMDELVDKIAESQTHATRKIREQAAELKKFHDAVKPTTATVSVDDEFILSQEMAKSPSQATKKTFKALLGFDIEELKTIKERVDAYAEAGSRNDAVSTFIASHPDYVDTQKNTDLVQLYMQNKKVSSEELHKAYLHLKKSGLLELKAEGQNSGQQPKPEPEERIVLKGPDIVTSLKTTKVSGLSTHAPRVPSATEPSEDDAYNLPMSELRKRAEAQLAKRG